MKKGFVMIIILSLFVLKTIEAQVRIVNSTSSSAAFNSSAFIDASSNNTANLSSNVGKGLLFPRTDLTGFSAFSGSPTGLSVSYPTRFDGMIVYNVARGTAAIGSTEVSPGFYYYDNKTSDVNGGKWIRMADGSDGENIVYYGVLNATNPGLSEVTGLNSSVISSGSYNGRFNLTLSGEGYFTIAVPVAWRNPLLTINGDETFNILIPVVTIDLNGVSYQVWQSDISLKTGMTVAIK